MRQKGLCVKNVCRFPRSVCEIKLSYIPCTLPLLLKTLRKAVDVSRFLKLFVFVIPRGHPVNINESSSRPQGDSYAFAAVVSSEFYGKNIKKSVNIFPFNQSKNPIHGL